ncbi:MAG: hypothetical protein JXJ19_05200 [Elusimicrobia bacterium]|nr:hypothetical protein [Elusimicrobiota bacterium]
MNWLIIACLLLMFLTIEMRLNDLKNSTQELNSNFQRCLTELSNVKKKIRGGEDKAQEPQS